MAKFDRFVESDGGSDGGIEREDHRKFEGEKIRGNKEGKNTREVKGREDERGDSWKLVEKVKPFIVILRGRG